jgi:hypothetical protein
MENQKGIRIDRVIYGLLLVLPTIIFWSYVIRMYFFGFRANHFTDAIVFLTGALSIPLFFVSILAALIKRDKGMWLISTFINGSPLAGFALFWGYLWVADYLDHNV